MKMINRVKATETVNRIKTINRKKQGETEKEAKNKEDKQRERRFLKETQIETVRYTKCDSE
jgi:hypothetical protein